MSLLIIEHTSLLTQNWQILIVLFRKASWKKKLDSEEASIAMQLLNKLLWLKSKHIQSDFFHLKVNYYTKIAVNVCVEFLPAPKIV